MKTASVAAFFFILAALSVGIGAENARAQPSPGNLTVFADQSASSCSVNDTAPGVVTVYVLHTNFSEMLSSDFRVAVSSGFHGTYLNETHAQLGHVGDFRNGISFGYGGCASGPLLLGTMSYQLAGTSEPCSYFDIVAFRLPWPWTEDCSFNDWPAPPLGKLYVNPSPQCPPYCVVATEPTTWGSVKALYR
jgi:hypothetical protein